MNEVSYAFDAQPRAVFRVGLHWFEVVTTSGILGLLVFTSDQRYHYIHPPFFTGLFQDVWVGFVGQHGGGAACRISIRVLAGTVVHALTDTVLA